jgi:hypothetical protein
MFVRAGRKGVKVARSRVIDVEKAIETATDLCWWNGHGRTSLAHLTNAMEITPPSFHFALGSKEELCKRVLRTLYADLSHLCRIILERTDGKAYIGATVTSAYCSLHGLYASV